MRMCRRKSGTHCGCNIAGRPFCWRKDITYILSLVPAVFLDPSSAPFRFAPPPLVGTTSFATLQENNGNSSSEESRMFPFLAWNVDGHLTMTPGAAQHPVGTHCPATCRTTLTVVARVYCVFLVPRLSTRSPSFPSLPPRLSL